MAVLIGAVNGTLTVMESFSTPPERSAQVIAAEAAGEGFASMIGVGEVIRARGSYEGFSVMFKDLPEFFGSESRWTRIESRAAWALSKWGLVSGGATHFENVRRFGRPPWSKGMTLAAWHGGIEFYRKRRPWDALFGKIKI